ncbi:MAG: hypothetical protein ABI688_09090 [Bacteroidota bacterium]
MRLPFKALLVLGLILVLGHNLLDIPEAKPGFKASLTWDLLHHGSFVPYEFAPNHFALLVYPFVAWTGLMLLGYCSGIFFTSGYSMEQRRKIFIRLGLGLIVFFIALRYPNIYGDPFDWSRQKNGFYTFLSFMKVHKYPPSLLYMSITIGPALLLLAFLEQIRNRFTNAMLVFGRTAFFYYILHIYLIHLVAAIVFFAKGDHTMKEAIESMYQVPFLFVFRGEGFGLPVVYAIWIGVVIFLYPVCRWYDKYKRTHKEKRWLSYL